MLAVMVADKAILMVVIINMMGLITGTVMVLKWMVYIDGGNGCVEFRSDDMKRWISFDVDGGDGNFGD